MARVCLNRNKKTGRFQKRKTKNTKRSCFSIPAKRKGSKKPCRVSRGPRKGQFKRCR